MELPVVLLPAVRLSRVSLQDETFDVSELVMGGQHRPLPLQVTRAEGLLHRVLLEKQSKSRDVLEAVSGNTHDLKAALSLRKNKSLGGQSVEDLAKRVYARSVAMLEAIQPEPFARSKSAENDVGLEAMVDVVSDTGCPGRLSRHFEPLRYRVVRNNRRPYASLAAAAFSDGRASIPSGYDRELWPPRDRGVPNAAYVAEGSEC